MKKIIFYVLMSVCSVSLSLANEINVEAGRFFNNCDYIGTQARVQISGTAARRLFKTLEESTEETFNGQIMRYTENIRCLKRSDDVYSCYFVLASNGTFSAPQWQQQQQHQRPQHSRPQIDLRNSSSREQQQQQQQQRQQQQAPQQQCPVTRIVFN